MTQPAPTFRDDDSLLTEIKKHPFIACAALVGIVVAVKLLFHKLAADDEAPIRVRGGSVILDLDAGATWDQAGNHFKTQGTRKHPTYKVSVTRKKTSACRPPFNRYRKLVITLTSGESITLDPTGNHTKVTGPDGCLSNGDTRLSFGPAGSRISHVDFEAINGDIHPCDYADGDLDNIYLEA